MIFNAFKIKPKKYIVYLHFPIVLFFWLISVFMVNKKNKRCRTKMETNSERNYRPLLNLFVYYLHQIALALCYTLSQVILSSLFVSSSQLETQVTFLIPGGQEGKPTRFKSLLQNTKKKYLKSFIFFYNIQVVTFKFLKQDNKAKEDCLNFDCFQILKQKIYEDFFL